SSTPTAPSTRPRCPTMAVARPSRSSRAGALGARLARDRSSDSLQPPGGRGLEMPELQPSKRVEDVRVVDVAAGDDAPIVRQLSADGEIERLSSAVAHDPTGLLDQQCAGGMVPDLL